MAAIEQMRTMLIHTDQHVGRSLGLTEKAAEKSSDRLRSLEKMQKAMTAMRDSNKLLGELQASFLAIRNKTKMINDIVFKTQLLSFNATIEASRAGQLGKGFSVVAEEVGRLAQTSGRAAKEIEELIAESQKKATLAVQQVIARAEDGEKVAEDVIADFRDVNHVIVEITKNLKSMSEASREQVQGMEQTATAIERINKIADDNRHQAESALELAEKVGDSESAISKAQKSDSTKTPAKGDWLKLVENLAHEMKSKPAAQSKSNLDADHDSFKKQV